MIKVIVFLTAFSALSFGAASARGGSWQINKSTHFIVHYEDLKDDFVIRVIDKAEDYYNKIADDLGFRRFDFWLWDNRAKIYIYDNIGDYQAATLQPAWSAGCANMAKKEIYTYRNAPEFLDTVLPHEMGHVIFREFVGVTNTAVPRWLDEGVASYQMKTRGIAAKMIVRQAMKENKFMNLEQLSRFNPVLTSDTESVNIFYIESLTVIEYLISRFGRDSFVSFCQKLRDDKDLARALRYAYSFDSIQDLDRAWQKYLNE